MSIARSSGILLHPTSLPGPYGIGELGSSAYRFVDFLAEGGQRWWQVLPLGPTAEGNSPYTPYSTAAGNPLLISLELLAHQQLLTESELTSCPVHSPDRIDFESLEPWKLSVLRSAFARFRSRSDPLEEIRFRGFCRANAHWLDDFALFMGYRTENPRPWSEWSEGIRSRTPEALIALQRRLSDEISFQRFLQYIFWSQWQALKQYANCAGIGIIGDLPIYVSYDSADVWSRPEGFALDPETRKPTVVAGVPPDYFSTTGQRWGNPLYDWDQMQATGFRWWLWRIEELLTQVDLVRLDHFRGLLAYWEIPASEPTAIKGRWREAPGYALLEATLRRLGRLPIIAEDLGVIGQDVTAFREHFGLPGMKILQFAFDDDSSNPYLPHNVDINSVAYTGTHDNNTTAGWYQQDATTSQKACLHRYLPAPTDSIAWDLMRMAFGSPAKLVVTPFQDLIEAGAEARMNVPNVPDGNWRWRLRQEDIRDDIARRLCELTRIYARIRRPVP